MSSPKNLTQIITLLQTLKNLTTNTTSEEISEKKKQKFLWLLFFDLIIFISLTYTTYTSSKNLENEEQIDENSDFRPKFIKWLVVANGVRSLSLIFILLFGNPNGNNAISWLNSILHVGPAFLFVSSYMYLSLSRVIMQEQVKMMGRYILCTVSWLHFSSKFLFK